MKGEIEVLDDDGEHEENVDKKIEKDPMRPLYQNFWFSQKHSYILCQNSPKLL